MHEKLNECLEQISKNLEATAKILLAIAEELAKESQPRPKHEDYIYLDRDELHL